MSGAPPTAESNFQAIEARRAANRGSVIAGAELTGPYLAMNVAAALIFATSAGGMGAPVW